MPLTLAGGMAWEKPASMAISLAWLAIAASLSKITSFGGSMHARHSPERRNGTSTQRPLITSLDGSEMRIGDIAHGRL